MTADDWPVIPLAGPEVIVGRSRRCDVVLPHSSISGRHARFLNDGAHVEVEDLDSRFGTLVNGTRVRRYGLAIGDIVRFGNSPPYCFEGGRLLPDAARTGLVLTLRSAGVQDDRGKWLLANISAHIQPGQFVGLLGPSGSGKTLLLELLGALRPPDAGEICFDDGRSVVEHADEYQLQIGQVPQQDLIYPSLTGWENIEMAAALRLPDYPSDQRRRRSEKALEDVALLEHRGKLAAKLSGGQQKRLSIAIELLREPRLLILDEPTSGLDPGLQGRLMDLLRRLAHQGTTIVCSTHTLDTLNYFDSVLVLGINRYGVGTLAYSGPPGELLTTHGVRHAADLYDQLQHLGESSAATAPVPPPSHDDGPVLRGGSETSAATATRVVAPLAISAVARELEQRHLLLQLYTVLRRSWLMFVRDKMVLTTSACQPLLLAGLVVLSQHDRSGSVYVHFFLVVCALWMGMTLTVREFVRERPHYQRDRLAGLHPDAYLGGRLAAAVIPLVGQIITLYLLALALVWLMVDGKTQGITRTDLLDQPSWARALSVLLIAGLGGVLIGTMISTLAKSERAAVAMLPIAILPQLLLSRVATGAAGHGWSDPSPFMPLADMSLHWLGGASWPGMMAFLGSLPLVTRPATSSLNMLGPPSPPLIGEWLYLILLLLLHVLAAYLLFRSHKGRILVR